MDSGSGHPVCTPPRICFLRWWLESDGRGLGPLPSHCSLGPARPERVTPHQAGCAGVVRSPWAGQSYSMGEEGSFQWGDAPLPGPRNLIIWLILTAALRNRGQVQLGKLRLREASRQAVCGRRENLGLFYPVAGPGKDRPGSGPLKGIGHWGREEVRQAVGRAHRTPPIGQASPLPGQSRSKGGPRALQPNLGDQCMLGGFPCLFGALSSLPGHFCQSSQPSLPVTEAWPFNIVPLSNS